MSLHRIPAWLARERYAIDYDPTAPGRWAVTLHDERGPSRGFGPTIALAARRAKLRDSRLIPLGNARASRADLRASPRSSGGSR